MTPERVRLVLRVDAVLHIVVGALLVSASWDGLYDAIDLPKPSPALLAQLGGIAVAGLGYLVWAAANDPALRRPVATATGLANGAAAITIALWLLFRGKEDLQIGDAGIAVLAVAAVVLAAVAVAELLAARLPE